MEQTTVWELISEDLSGLGGRMGIETVTTNWNRLFSTPGKAKMAARKDYRTNSKTKASINWEKVEDGFYSGDLGFVSYRIVRRIVE
ncbi:MAG: hypothetical protein GWN86_30230 [Desulfobacterales bacterium]|nr:hypothetical protein [Desulfobacterales bacterium]